MSNLARHVAKLLLGLAAFFMLFVAAPLVAWALGAGEASPIAMIAVPLAVVLGHAAYLLGGLLWEALRA